MDEARKFLEDHPEIDFIDGLLCDLSGVFRGKRVARDGLLKVYREGFQMAASAVLLDVTGDSCDPGGRGFDDGDPDAIGLPVPGTLAPVPWLDGGHGQMLISFHEQDGRPYFTDPRHVLAGVVGRFDELGLRPVVAVELEFYLIDPQRDDTGAPRPPLSPVTGRRLSQIQVYGIEDLEGFDDFISEMVETCRVQSLPVGPISSEFASSQFEINLKHVEDPVAAADQAALLQRAVRGVARRHALEATFMAKPFPAGAGSGTHIHLSLLDGEGRNVFRGENAEGSETLRHAIGGLLETWPEAMAVFAPNINSYRRFAPDLYAPITRSWAFNNRSVAVRIPGGEDTDRRLEHRIAGADANPHLVMAAVLAGAHYGIVNKTGLLPQATGNASAKADLDLPWNLHQGLAAMAAAKVIPDYLGAEYCELYRQCKQGEMESFLSHVPPLEYAWYLRTE